MPTKIHGLLAAYSRERLKEALEKNKASENFAVRDATKTPFVKGRGYVPSKEKEINYTPSVDITDNVMGFMPIVGDALQGGQAAIDFANGDYKKAALNAGLLFVPNALEKPIKYAGKLLRRLPVERAIAKNAPYAGRNFVRHGVPSGYVSDVLRGESRAMTPSLAVNRIDEFNIVGDTPFQYGDYTFIGDKSLLDDSMIFHGDAASPVIGDVIYGFDSVPSEMREEVSERLWQETVNGPYKAIGKKVNVEDLSHLPTNQSDTYFEAIHHGTVPYERFKGVIAEEPGRHLYPTGLSKNKEEDILNWFDNNGVKVKTYDPLYKPYAGYNGWAESILDMTQDFGDDVLFEGGGKIYIKPSHRGRLTELKERTGKTEAELYNDGNPAHKKMVVFARNSRKWHRDGGPLDLSGIKTTNNRPYNADYISYINDALKSGGMGDMQRAAVLANIIEESGGDPFAEGPGGFYGLIQWSSERYPKTKETDIYKEIDNQVKYILDTASNETDKMSWTHGGKGSGYNSLKDAISAFGSDKLENVMRGYTLGYVRPAGGVDSYNNRLKVARQLYDTNGFREFDAGGFIQKYGKDKVLQAIAKMKQSQ